MNDIVLKAILFATQAYGSQVDDMGKLSLNHPAQVARILEIVTNDREIIAAGWLHDIIEDTQYTYEDIETYFGQRIALLVHEVTHEGKKDWKGFYFPRLRSKDAILIKFADRLSNLSRMENWDEKRKQHYLKKSKFWRSEV